MTITFSDYLRHDSLNYNQTQYIREVGKFTKTYFENPKFDASHDFQHVMRVVRNAIRILDEENEKRKTVEGPLLDACVVILGALLHDVDDKKYVQSANSETQVSFAKQELVRLGMSAEQATKIQRLVEGVSYSSEIKDPDRVVSLIAEIPELAVVQDADRLDAIGAIGVGRCFTFGATHGARTLGDSILHFEDKLVKLEALMKTSTGQRLAAERTRRLRDFMGWWEEEISFSGPA